MSTNDLEMIDINFTMLSEARQKSKKHINLKLLNMRKDIGVNFRVLAV